MADMRMRGFYGLRLLAGPNWLSPRLGRFTGESFERSGFSVWAVLVWGGGTRSHTCINLYTLVNYLYHAWLLARGGIR